MKQKLTYLPFVFVLFSIAFSSCYYANKPKDPSQQISTNLTTLTLIMPDVSLSSSATQSSSTGKVYENVNGNGTVLYSNTNITEMITVQYKLIEKNQKILENILFMGSYSANFAAKKFADLGLGKIVRASKTNEQSVVVELLDSNNDIYYMTLMDGSLALLKDASGNYIYAPLE
jgi:hypothetical protein